MTKSMGNKKKRKENKTAIENKTFYSQQQQQYTHGCIGCDTPALLTA